MVTDPGAPLRAHRLRPLNRPRRVLVELNRRDLPAAVLEDRENPETANPPNRQSVESVGEIWRVDDEWWRRSVCRRYVEVILEEGKHVMLYEDLTTGEWFEQTI